MNPLKIVRWILPSLAVALGTLAACESPETSAQDPRPVLAALVGNVVLPTYQALDERAEILRVSATELAMAPSEASLAKTRDAFVATRAAWKKSEAFRVGPPEVTRIGAAIDYWPASADAIGRAVASPTSRTKEGVDALGANAKGFMALEFLLFDSASSHATVLPALTTGPDAEARRSYVRALAESLRGESRKLLALWSPSGQNLSAELAEGRGFFVSGKVAVDQIVRQLVFTSIAIESTRLGKPLGRQNGGTIVPSLEESPRSDGSLRDLESALAGIRAIYRGEGLDDEAGIDDLVRAKSPAIDQHVVRELDSARAALLAIPPPLRVALRDAPASVTAAFDASRKLKSTLATELVSALGVTLTFSDSDGD